MRPTLAITFLLLAPAAAQAPRTPPVAKAAYDEADMKQAEAKAAGDDKKTLDLLTKAKTAFAKSESQAKIGAAIAEVKGGATK